MALDICHSQSRASIYRPAVFQKVYRQLICKLCSLSNDRFGSYANQIYIPFYCPGNGPHNGPWQRKSIKNA